MGFLREGVTIQSRLVMSMYVILLPQPLKSCDYRHVTLIPGFYVATFEASLSCIVRDCLKKIKMKSKIRTFLIMRFWKLSHLEL